MDLSRIGSRTPDILANISYGNFERGMAFHQTAICPSLEDTRDEFPILLPMS